MKRISKEPIKVNWLVHALARRGTRWNSKARVAEKAEKVDACRTEGSESGRGSGWPRVANIRKRLDHVAWIMGGLGLYSTIDHFPVFAFDEDPGGSDDGRCRLRSSRCRRDKGIHEDIVIRNVLDHPLQVFGYGDDIPC